jgi:hypothetical protein
MIRLEFVLVVVADSRNTTGGSSSMYGRGSGSVGPVVAGAGTAVLPVTGGNPVLMVLAAAVIAVGGAIVLSSLARFVASKTQG